MFTPSSNAKPASHWGSLIPYLLALALAGLADDLPPRLIPAAITLGGLAGWTRYYRRYRLVADTPTATTRAVAQGYSECFGEAVAPGGTPLVTPFRQMRCVWYHAERVHSGERRHSRAERHTSDASFVLRDARGDIVIDPAGARVTCRHHQQWHDGDWLYQEHWIAPGDPLYVLGDCRTTASRPDRQAFRDDLSCLLDEWKRDSPQLLQRFDQNGDGQLSADEWEQARQAAHRSISEQHDALARLPDHTTLQRPADGRPFLIDWRPPQQLAASLRRLSWLHAAAGLAGMLWLWQLR